MIEKNNSTGSMAQKDYAASHYLLFGATTDDSYRQTFDVEGALDYLEKMGISSDNALSQARKLRRKANQFAGWHEPTERFCDFCGRPLSGVEYDRLKDGRDRCTGCSKTVVKGRENYESLFRQVREGLIEKYGIDLPSRVSIEVVSTKKLARAAGKPFVASRYFDPRCVGLATRRGNEYGLIFENGVPKMSMISTTAHELTHIWQYSHWNAAIIKKKYGELELAVYEGMAKWAEIQYLYLINESAQAERSLVNEIQRDDVYGYGLRLFVNQYPFSRGIVLEGDTPFSNLDEPLKL